MTDQILPGFARRSPVPDRQCFGPQRGGRSGRVFFGFDEIVFGQRRRQVGRGIARNVGVLAWFLKISRTGFAVVVMDMYDTRYVYRSIDKSLSTAV